MKIDLSNRKDMFYWQTNRPITAEETKRIFIDRYSDLDEVTMRKIVDYGLKQAGYAENERVIEQLDPIIRHGSVNSVIPIVLQNNKKIVLRLHPKQVKNGYFWVEKAATDRARVVGVPTYSTVFIDDSQTVFPFDFMIMTAVSGKPMSSYKPLSLDLDKTLVTQTGKYAALIHTIETTGFGFYDNQVAKTSAALKGQYDYFHQHIHAALGADLKFLVDHSVLSMRQNNQIEKLFQQSNSLMDCKQGVLIHNDVADWNEMSDGKAITGIMDWDECFSGDPLMEVAAYNLFFGTPRIDWFREGYEQVSRLEKNEDKFQLFKLRYLISKMHLRTKRSTIDPSETIKQNMKRGLQAMKEVFTHFKF